MNERTGYPEVTNGVEPQNVDTIRSQVRGAQKQLLAAEADLKDACTSITGASFEGRALHETCSATEELEALAETIASVAQIARMIKDYIG